MTSSIEKASAPGDEWGPPLTADEQECLRCIAGHMIPESAELGMPGADDPMIVADIVGSVRRDRQPLARVLRSVDEAAGGSLASLEVAGQAELLSRLRGGDPTGFAVVEAVIARAYYRDDRVLRSIGMEPRPPFPAGFQVEQGDWSLLDPVRKRGAMYRSPS